MKLVECVPNVSEGRDASKIQELAELLRSWPGVSLAHVTSDADHNRSVFTYLGTPAAVLEATTAFCARAFELIDMREHEGCHPRMGAVDVVPFVPLGDTEMREAVELAHRLGQAVGEMGVPVYFYEEAALREDRRNLADVRRGEYECLSGRAAGREAGEAADAGGAALGREGGVVADGTESGGGDEARGGQGGEEVGGGEAPDAGPHHFNPRSGACIIGARRPLIAFNVNLGTQDLEVAQDIARAVRQSNGGLPAVKAMGVEIKELGVVQVSMNLVDYRVTGMHEAFAAVREEAAKRGVPVVESELIGLAPLEAVLDVARRCLQLRELGPERVIESHLLGDD